eukprot:m.96965 g.96965  ORF g.96965 m.96965 type:complete len:101 (-) comp13958_c0_seq2:90-392(-)
MPPYSRSVFSSAFHFSSSRWQFTVSSTVSQFSTASFTCSMRLATCITARSTCSSGWLSNRGTSTTFIFQKTLSTVAQSQSSLPTLLFQANTIDLRFPLLF